MSNNVRVTVTGDSRSATSAVNDVSGAMGGLNLKAIAATAAIAGAGAAAISFANTAKEIAADYEFGFRRVETLFAFNREEVAHLEQGVRDLAKTYGLDLTNAIDATYQALSAGVSADDAMQFLEDSATAAVGGAFELTGAVDVLTSSLNAYGFGADQAGRFSDVLFATVRLGKTDMDKLSRSMFQVAPIAASAGVSFEQVGAGLSTITKTGTTTKIAATQMRQIIAEMLKPADNLADALERLGFETGKAALESRGLQGILADLERDAAANGIQFAEIFGSVEAFQGVLALTGRSARVAASDLKAIQAASGETQAAFDIMSDSATVTRRKLEAEFRDAKLEIGEILLPSQVEFMQKLTGWLQDARDAYDEEGGRGLGRSIGESMLEGISDVIADADMWSLIYELQPGTQGGRKFRAWLDPFLDQGTDAITGFVADAANQLNSLSRASIGQLIGQGEVGAQWRGTNRVGERASRERERDYERNRSLFDSYSEELRWAEEVREKRIEEAEAAEKQEQATREYLASLGLTHDMLDPFANVLAVVTDRELAAAQGMHMFSGETARAALDQRDLKKRIEESGSAVDVLLEKFESFEAIEIQFEIAQIEAKIQELEDREAIGIELTAEESAELKALREQLAAKQRLLYEISVSPADEATVQSALDAMKATLELADSEGMEVSLSIPELTEEGKQQIIDGVHAIFAVMGETYDDPTLYAEAVADFATLFNEALADPNKTIQENLAVWAKTNGHTYGSETINTLVQFIEDNFGRDIANAFKANLILQENPEALGAWHRLATDSGREFIGKLRAYLDANNVDKTVRVTIYRTIVQSIISSAQESGQFVSGEAEDLQTETDEGTLASAVGTEGTVTPVPLSTTPSSGTVQSPSDAAAGLIGAATQPFARGGIVTGPTRGLLGDAGTEVVMPLSQLPALLAALGGGGMGGGSGQPFEIVLNLDSHEMFRQVFRTGERLDLLGSDVTLARV